MLAERYRACHLSTGASSFHVSIIHPLATPMIGVSRTTSGFTVIVLSSKISKLLHAIQQGILLQVTCSGL